VSRGCGKYSGQQSPIFVIRGEIGTSYYLWLTWLGSYNGEPGSSPGGLGVYPRKARFSNWFGPGCQSRQFWNCSSDSAPSEARKRGSGGGSPRKYDDLLTGPSAPQVQSSSAPRAKRENGGLGEDPPGITMDSLTGPSDLQVHLARNYLLTHLARFLGMRIGGGC
jgi:hypothetical protein